MANNNITSKPITVSDVTFEKYFYSDGASTSFSPVYIKDQDGVIDIDQPGVINAADIHWNGAETEINGIPAIQTTGDLIKFIRASYLSSGNFEVINRAPKLNFHEMDTVYNIADIGNRSITVRMPSLNYIGGIIKNYISAHLIAGDGIKIREEDGNIIIVNTRTSAVITKISWNDQYTISRDVTNSIPTINDKIDAKYSDGNTQQLDSLSYDVYTDSEGTISAPDDWYKTPGQYYCFGKVTGYEGKTDNYHIIKLTVNEFTGYFWYAGQTKPNGSEVYPQSESYGDWDNYTNNKWHILMGNKIQQTITGGSPNTPWYVAVPKFLAMGPYASDGVTTDPDWIQYESINVGYLSYTNSSENSSLPYDIWKSNSKIAKVNINMKAQ